MTCTASDIVLLSEQMQIDFIQWNDSRTKDASQLSVTDHDFLAHKCNGFDYECQA